MSYNPYIDYRSYAVGDYDLMNEPVPANSSFASFKDERCFYQETETVSYPAVIGNVINNNITPLDKKIVSFVASYTFITSKQLSEFLSLMGIEFNDKKLKSSLERLKRNQILRSCCFGTDEEHMGVFLAYSLNKYGFDIAKVLGIPHNYSPMQPALPPADIKRVLAANQIMLAYLKSGLKIDWLKKSQVITSKENKSAVVRPALAIGIDGDNILIEVVRKGDFWQQYLSDKLERYKLILDNWGSNSWELTEKPIIVINGENLEHNREILSISEQLGIDVYFTEDILNCGANFYHSIYSLAAETEPEYYCFDDRITAA